ncbi:hypothetical protein E2C01_014643 [Portunus trituberculatus]|uniref:Uncharacterized protein n=1 Tax=Portunus trituberculatus TaxID=210409 RepID=A0A5B7DJD9_PORTR|nr:hypothetical protein [Portunus trituberculatus]
MIHRLTTQSPLHLQPSSSQHSYTSPRHLTCSCSHLPSPSPQPRSSHCRSSPLPTHRVLISFFMSSKLLVKKKKSIPMIHLILRLNTFLLSKSPRFSAGATLGEVREDRNAFRPE